MYGFTVNEWPTRSGGHTPCGVSAAIATSPAAACRRHFIIEDRLDGKYVKYNSNSGFVDQDYVDGKLSEEGV